MATPTSGFVLGLDELVSVGTPCMLELRMKLAMRDAGLLCVAAK
jgi:hypothetical protein